MGKACRVALLFSTSLLVLVISVTFSLVTWRDLHAIRTTPLPGVPCVVETSQVTPCPTLPGQFTVRVTLRPFRIHDSYIHPNEQNDIVAYPTADSSECPFTTRAEAQLFADELPPDAEKECYTDGNHISLSPGFASSKQIYKYLLRTIFPIVAAALSGLVTLYAIVRLSVVYCMARSDVTPPLGPQVSRLRSVPMDDIMGDPGNLDTFGLARPPSVSRRGSKRALHRTDAKKLVRKLRGLGDVSAGSTCPICLEEFGGDNDPGGEAVKLPCSHEYHEQCVLQWFQKGSATCPYCGSDCRLELSEDDDSKLVVSAAEVSARDAGRGWRRREVGREDLPGP